MAIRHRLAQHEVAGLGEDYRAACSGWESTLKRPRTNFVRSHFVIIFASYEPLLVLSKVTPSCPSRPLVQPVNHLERDYGMAQF